MPIKRRSNLPAVVSSAPDIEDNENESFENVRTGPDMAGFFTSKPVEDMDSAELRQLQKAERLMGFGLGNNGQTRHPKDVAVSELLRGIQMVENVDDPQFGRIEEFYRNRVRSPLTAIRAMCVIKEGGPKAANNCTSTSCPLWAFRNGTNAFFNRKS